MARRAIHRLVDRAVKTARPGLYPDGGGLYLQVTLGSDGTPRRSWLFRFAITDAERVANPKLGRERRMGLGPYPDVTLADARQAATDARKLRQDGLDPIDYRGAQLAARRATAAKAMTFDQCRDGYLDAHRAGWRSARHASDWLISMRTYVSPVFGHLPVTAIDTGLVLKALEPIWKSKTETASRVRGRIEAVFAWATVRGHRSGANPAQWKNHLDKMLPKRTKVAKVEHYAALPYAEIGTFMAQLQGQDSVASQAMRFLILTAARSGEVTGARWSEIDLAAKVWTVPAGRMKSNREHRVPLSDAACAIIEEARSVRSGDRVFPVSQSRMTEMPKESGQDVTVHGFRSTFRDWAAERTNFPREVAEAALAHVNADRTEAAYQRSDLFGKRRRLMEAWAKYCATAPAEGNIVLLTKGGA